MNSKFKFLKNIIKQTARRNSAEKAFFKKSQSLKDKISSGRYSIADNENMSKVLSSMKLEFLDENDFNWRKNSSLLHIFYNKMKGSTRPHLNTHENDEAYIKKYQNDWNLMHKKLDELFPQEVSNAA